MSWGRGLSAYSGRIRASGGPRRSLRRKLASGASLGDLVSVRACPKKTQVPRFSMEPDAKQRSIDLKARAPLRIGSTSVRKLFLFFPGPERSSRVLSHEKFTFASPHQISSFQQPVLGGRVALIRQLRIRPLVICYRSTTRSSVPSPPQ